MEHMGNFASFFLLNFYQSNIAWLGNYVIDRMTGKKFFETMPICKPSQRPYAQASCT